MPGDVEETKEAFVWIWLPGETDPVVAGRLIRQGKNLVFTYESSYFERDNAIAIYTSELPLKPGLLPLLPGMPMPSCLRDAAPDAWGRRVILDRNLGLRGKAADTTRLDELTYLLAAGSDRIGALDFQRSASNYEPHPPLPATLEEVIDAARRVDEGWSLSHELEQVLKHAVGVGGARPKALFADGETPLIAKFPAARETYPVVKVEYLAMAMAARAGLDVAAVNLVSAAGCDVLLVERFDRTPRNESFERRAMVSGLTLLGLDEGFARYASYSDLAETVHHRFANASATLKELFGRLVFNILVGNTDDHARNHSAFWDGHQLSLTPAYDICPQARTGGEASQAMLITGQERLSQLSLALDAAATFLLSEEEAIGLVAAQIESIGSTWPDLADEARLAGAERNVIWGRQLLNPFAFEGLEGSRGQLADLGDQVREEGRWAIA
ncbi:HipA domain-containing protein [Pelagibius sp. 7325]|uniref:type II toxin-antitoxin system HipA family toxin n=1 Tax=Pelagibius sp. 7325 TaxID=3131994 RepID=UPI0030EB9DD6